MNPNDVAAIFKRNMTSLVREAASRRCLRAAHPAFGGPPPDSDVELDALGEREVA